MGEPVYAGIDVARNSFEVATTGQARTLNLANDESGHADLCQRLLPLSPRLVLLEATAGYRQDLALSMPRAMSRAHWPTGNNPN